MRRVSLNIPESQYWRQLDSGFLHDTWKNVIMRSIKDLNLHRVIVYGENAKTGLIMRSLLGDKFVCYLNGKTLDKSINIDFDAIIVATSPRHYSLISQVVENNFYDKDFALITCFCENKRDISNTNNLVQWENFSEYSIARWAHWDKLIPLSAELYGHPVNPAACDLKVYQDLLVLAFIRDNLAPGTRLLEIGGGNSRVLAHLARTYDCWNIDKLEGVGGGPLEANEAGYTLVRDYIGNFNPVLADNSFDLVFSISTLEHICETDIELDTILDDIDRVTISGGLNFHCLDATARNATSNQILPRIYETRSTCGTWVPLHVLRKEPDIYFMPKQSYENHRRAFSPGLSYEAFDKPTSMNVLWRK